MNSQERRAILEQILTETCENITTIDQRQSDDLDFHTLPIWTIEHLMTLAYHRGMQEGILSVPLTDDEA